MARKKDGKAAKTIAGVKVPKDLRSKLQPVIKAAENPIVQDIIAAGIAAASAAIANSKAVRAAAARAADDAEDIADAAGRSAKRSGSAAKTIAIDFARHFIDAYEGKSSGGGAKAKPKAKKAKGGKRSAGSGRAG